MIFKLKQEKCTVFIKTTTWNLRKCKKWVWKKMMFKGRRSTLQKLHVSLILTSCLSSFFGPKSCFLDLMWPTSDTCSKFGMAPSLDASDDQDDITCLGSGIPEKKKKTSLSTVTGTREWAISQLLSIKPFFANKEMGLKHIGSNEICCEISLQIAPNLRVSCHIN